MSSERNNKSQARLFVLETTSHSQTLNACYLLCQVYLLNSNTLIYISLQLITEFSE